MTEKIGVISDTHGLIRPQIDDIFTGCDKILHAGDVGSFEVLDYLNNYGTVTAVSGNCDRGRLARSLADEEYIIIGNLNIYIIHDINSINMDLVTAEIDVVIFGHSHMPKKQTKNGIIYFNPGGAGTRRFDLPITVGIMEIKDSDISVQHINLENIE